MASQALGPPDIAAVGALIADGSRAAMVSALLDGRSLPASELARVAGVTPQTASAHLRKLEESGLIRGQKYGRHRYFALAGPHVAELWETLARFAPPSPIRSLRASTSALALAQARTCYDHLAGRLGVALVDGLLQQGWLLTEDDEWRLTSAGRSGLAAFGLDLRSLGAGQRRLIRRCLDWSERRPHLSGGLGAAIAQRCLELGWLVRVERSRALRLTTAGKDGFAHTFGVVLE
jgi:DNA-binding transcriptional ArsR family regulator